MNMLRNFGFKLALFTFIAEVVKAGMTAWVCSILMGNGLSEVAYWVSALSIMLGYDFPIWSKFKGGKGVACFVGIFVFSLLGWVGLIWIVVCATIFCFVEYGAVISFIYLGGMSIAYTIFVWVEQIPYAWLITVIIWGLIALTIFKHRSNIKRLINHTENKIDFRAKLKNFVCHKKGEEIISEDEVSQSPEKEIIVEEKIENLEKEENNNDENPNNQEENKDVNQK